MSEIKECLEHGAGTCRNIDLIDVLRAERDKYKEALELIDTVIFARGNFLTEKQILSDWLRIREILQEVLK